MSHFLETLKAEILNNTTLLLQLYATNSAFKIIEKIEKSLFEMESESYYQGRP